LQPNDGGAPQNIQVVQIWCDPKYPDAHRDPALRRWMFRRAQDGIAALIRFNARDALTVFAPPFDIDGVWHEIAGGNVERHSLIDIVRVVSGVQDQFPARTRQLDTGQPADAPAGSASDLESRH
jgi:hypothetical protein